MNWRVILIGVCVLAFIVGEVIIIFGVCATVVSDSSDSNDDTTIVEDSENPFITDVVTFEGNEYCYAQKGSNPESHVVDYYHKHHMSTICSSDVDKAIAYIDSHNGVVVSMTSYSYEHTYNNRMVIAWNEY